VTSNPPATASSEATAAEIEEVDASIERVLANGEAGGGERLTAGRQASIERHHS
jgi:hypothetical protein